MHELEQWLITRDYEQGLILISKYGRQSTAGVYRRQGNNRSAINGMVMVINSLINFLKQPTEAVNGPAPIVTGTQTTPAPKLPSATRQAANALFSEMGMLHSRLGSTADQQERAAICAKLIDLQAQWADLMVEDQTGTAPAKQPRKVTQAKHLTGSDYQRLTLLRTKVTKAVNEQIPAYRAKLQANPRNRAISDKLEKRVKEVEQWREEIKQLEGGNGKQ